MSDVRGNREDRLSDPLQYERFVQLFAQVRDNLFAYIFALLPHWSDAEDVFQQASLVLWRKFDTFVVPPSGGEDRAFVVPPSGGEDRLKPELRTVLPEKDFLAWACRVAFYEVRNFRRTASRDRLRFNDALIEQLAEDRPLSPERERAHRDFLLDCIAKLSEEERALLNRAYEGETTIRQLAEELHRLPQTIYNRLNLLRRALFKCVEAAAKRRNTEP